MSERRGDRSPGDPGWSLSARADGDRVSLEIALPGRALAGAGDGPVTAVLSLDRAQARAFARALLAAAGDATERTFRGTDG